MSKKSFESSVYLMRDVPMERKNPPDPNDKWIRIHFKDVKVTGNRLPTGDWEGKSSYVDAIQDYVRVKTGNEKLLFIKELVGGGNGNGGGTGYDIYIHQRTVERLCLILPRPFLLLHFKLTAATGGEDKTIFEKRLELTDLLKEVLPESTGGFFQRQRLVPLEGVEAVVPLCDVILGWREPSQSVIKLRTSSFGENLFGRESSKDVAIICGNGVEIRCHRVILEGHSDVFAAMLSPNNPMKESELGRIDMTENSEEGISHLVRYLYGMELKVKDIPCDIAVELFKTGDKYKLEQLVEAIIKLLLNRGKGWYTPDDLLELYFHVKNLDAFTNLQEHSLTIMLCFPEELRVCERFQEIERTDPKATTELIWKLFDMMRKQLPQPPPPTGSGAIEDE